MGKICPSRIGENPIKTPGKANYYIEKDNKVKKRYSRKRKSWSEST